MEITKELRREILTDLRAESKKHKKQGRYCVPLAERERIAQKYGVSIATITKMVTEANLTWQRQWTEAERRDVWCNYEGLGAKVLSIKYKVTQRAIIQMIHDMRKAEPKNPNPWQRS